MHPGVTLFIHIILQHLKFTQTCSDIMFKRLQEPTYDQAQTPSATLVIFSRWSYYFLIKMAMNLTYDRTIVYHCYILFEKTNHFSMLVKASRFWTWSDPVAALEGSMVGIQPKPGRSPDFITWSRHQLFSWKHGDSMVIKAIHIGFNWV